MNEFNNSEIREEQATAGRLTNEEIRESGCMEDIVKAIEHDMTPPEDAIPQADPVKTRETIEKGVAEGYKKIETGVVSGYKKIETGVVSGYKKIEEGAVRGFRKVSDKFLEKFFSREGETVEQTRERLSRK